MSNRKYWGFIISICLVFLGFVLTAFLPALSAVFPTAISAIGGLYLSYIGSNVVQKRLMKDEKKT